MKTKVITDIDEWDLYLSLNFHAVGKRSHYPHVPPSFPVIVFSEEILDSTFNLTPEARHHFIEQADFVKMLPEALRKQITL